MVSILLAFAIDAWWNAFLDRREEREILVGLHEEFMTHRSDLERRVSRNLYNRDGLSRLLSVADPNGTPLTNAAMDTVLFTVVAASTWDPGRRTLDAVISSGRLELIRNEDLRGRLAAWSGVVDEVRDGELTLRSYVTQTLVPFLASKRVPMDRAFDTVGEWPVSTPLVGRSLMGYAAALRDPEFVSLVQFKLAWEGVSAREYEEALSKAREVIELIAYDLEDN